MNSVLSYIAGFVVLVLFAALVGPSIVDWNTFRAEIEEQISEAVGRDVTIGGDINFVILPAPRFSLGELSIGGGEGDLPLADVATLEGEVALAPLLRAEIDVLRVRALDFTVNIIRDENGRLNWSNLDAAVPDVPINPEAISLESMVFLDGDILFTDASASDSVRLSNVTGELTATSLVGPLKFDGSFDYDNAPYTLSFGMGSFGGDRAFPVNIDLAAPEFGWRSSFSGLSTDATASARLDGTFDFHLGDLEVDGEPAAVLKMTAGFVGNSETISLRDVELAIADATFDGDVQIDLKDGTRVTAALAGARLAVDQVLAQLQAAEVPIEALQIPQSLSGELALGLVDLSFDQAHASNVKADLRLDSGTLIVDSLTAELPGETRGSVSGTISFPQGVPRFDGSINATVGNIETLARLAGDLLRPEPQTDTNDRIYNQRSDRVRIQSELALQPSLLQAYSLSIASIGPDESASPITGGVSVALRARPAMSVELQGASIDADWIGWFLDVDNYEASFDLAAFDANVVLGFDQLAWSDQNLTAVDISASLLDGVLSIERFGAVLNGTDEISAVGTIANIGPFATGGLEGTMNAGLAKSIAGWMFDMEFPAVVGDGALAYLLRAEDTGEGHVSSLDMSGELNGSLTSLVVNQRRSLETSSVEKLDLVLSFDNPSGQALLEQIGLATLAPLEGSGRIRAQLSGAPGESLDTSLRVGFGDVVASVTGKTQSVFEAPVFEGRFEASAPTFSLASQVAGWQGPLVDLILVNAREGAFVAGGGLEWASDRVTLSEVEAIAGAFRVSGAGELDLEGATPAIDADISLGTLALDQIFETGEDEPWAADPLDWSMLAAVQGSFTIGASKISVADLVLEDVAAKGTLADGVLSFTPVTAELANGRLTMGARVEGGSGVPGIGLTLAAEEVSVTGASEMLFAEELGGGEATASLQLEGQGRSLLGMVSSLSGKGSLTLTAGELYGFDVPAFRTALNELSDIDDFDAVAAVHLDNGRTSFDQIEGSFSVDEGILKFVPTEIGISGADQTEITAMVDLVRLKADVETKLSLSGSPPLPPMAMVLAGPMRQLERRNDTLAIQQAVSQALLVRDIEEAGIDELPDGLRDLIIGPDAGPELDVPLEGVVEESVPTTPTPVERPTN